MFYFLSFSLLNFLFSRPEKGKKKKKASLYHLTHHGRQSLEGREGNFPLSPEYRVYSMCRSS
jgi:hypothetical protein